MIDIGAVLGSIITYLTAGWIISHWGWPYLFYIPGVISFLMSILFVTLTRNRPEEHPFITDEEVKKINPDGPAVSTGPSHHANKSPSPPWTAILSNKSVLAVMMVKFATMAGYSFVYLELPKYLSEVAHEDITRNGNVNAGVNMLAAFSMITCGAVSEKVIQMGCTSRTATRKIFSLFVGFGCATCFALTPVVTCQPYLLYTILCLVTFFGGCYTGSDGPIVSEMTKHFPASLYAMFNMISMSTGFIVPYFVGLVLDANQDDPTRGWAIAFYSGSGLMVAANIVFLLFANASQQTFDLEVSGELPVVVRRKSLDVRGTFFEAPDHV
jgi:sugar phosphate permease